MMKNLYITTTLPYVNAEPHIGFAMEIIRADIIARSKKNDGFDVFFNTGTDEHGQKLFEAAKLAGKDVQSYVDEYAEKFKTLKSVLGLSDDLHFIRTTDPHHEKAAQEFWNRVMNNGFIYKKNYKTKYCVGCEENKTDSELVDGRCPIHPTREIEIIDEENYFFKLSSFGDRLLELYDGGKFRVVPEFRLNEMREFIKRGLEDFSISRLKSKMSWGIPVPGDDSHVMYVWFDALVNYLSTLGWPENKEMFKKYWENGTPIQYCGKDNTRFQSVMWQAMLLAADLPNTSTIVVDGFITGDKGVKMSKSIGNVISPVDIVNEYGTDALRYFLSREVSAFEDSPFTIERFKAGYNASLANGLGNLVSRVMKMVDSYEVKYELPKVEEIKDGAVDEFLNKFELDRAIDKIFTRVSDMNVTIQESKPFSLVKTDPDAAKKIVGQLAIDLFVTAHLLLPFMPQTAENIKNLVVSHKVPENPLFLRKD